MVGNQEEERKSVYFSRQKNVKGGVLIFVVADIWNCYNMEMKKATNLKVLIIFKQPHCMEIRNGKPALHPAACVCQIEAADRQRQVVKRIFGLHGTYMGELY